MYNTGSWWAVTPRVGRPDSPGRPSGPYIVALAAAGGGRCKGVGRASVKDEKNVVPSLTAEQPAPRASVSPSKERHGLFLSPATGPLAATG